MDPQENYLLAMALVSKTEKKNTAKVITMKLCKNRIYLHPGEGLKDLGGGGDCLILNIAVGKQVIRRQERSISFLQKLATATESQA